VGYRDDTWTWDGQTWTEANPAPTPPPRAVPGIAYDPVTTPLVMFGGLNGSSRLGDTWTWDGSTGNWTYQDTATRPPGVTGPMLFTDPLNGHVDMFGGFDGRLYQNTTWQWTGTDWVDVHPPESATARAAAIAELDRATHTVVMFSGLANLNAYDTWTWDGRTWTRQAPQQQPPARFFSSSAYEPALRSVLIFGGGSGYGDLHDTWIWTGTDWERIHPGPPPTQRESQGMAFDQATHRIVLFGGQVGRSVVNDTWTL